MFKRWRVSTENFTKNDLGPYNLQKEVIVNDFVFSRSKFTILLVFVYRYNIVLLYYLLFCAYYYYCAIFESSEWTV